MSSSKEYPGSCHCGYIQYRVRLTFPPVHDPTAKSIRLYKCNCTVCHKMGFFHCRPISPKDDFTLISPTDIDNVGIYRTNTETSGWYFCRKCGVHVFGVAGVWQQTVPLVEGSEWDENEERKVVRPVLKTMPTTRTKMADGKETTEPYHYVSVNAVTLEPNEDIDLGKWHEKGWVFYVDSKDHKGPPRPGKPHDGGMY